MTLFEAFHRKKPSISHLQPFGRKWFVHILKERRLSRSKLMLRAQEGIFLGYTDTPYIYKVHISACSHTFTVFALDVKFEDTAIQSLSTADSHLGVEVTMEEVITLDVNLSHSPITATLISFARPITHSMIDSQQSMQPQQPPQQFSQPQCQSQTTAVVIPPSLPDS